MKRVLRECFLFVRPFVSMSVPVWPSFTEFFYDGVFDFWAYDIACVSI